MERLARLGHHEVVRVPFVTSIVLTLFASESTPAQSYAAVIGHLVSSIAGLAALICLGPGDAAATLGVGAAALLMMASRALHPPAGVDAFLIAQLDLPWSWIVNPVPLVLYCWRPSHGFGRRVAVICRYRDAADAKTLDMNYPLLPNRRSAIGA
jgi:hypothetical protein